MQLILFSVKNHKRVTISETKYEKTNIQIGLIILKKQIECSQLPSINNVCQSKLEANKWKSKMQNNIMYINR